MRGALACQNRCGLYKEGLFDLTSPGQLDTQRIAVDRFWEVARMGQLLAIGLHAVFALAGWLADAMPLVALQGVTVALYGIAYIATSRGHLWLAVAIAWIDLLGHATLACWIVGVESGFQYYSWILLPLVFANVHRKVRVKVALAVALAVFYVLIDWWLTHTTPLVTVDATALAALRYFNIACYMLALGVIAAAHARTVSDAERRLNSLASTDTLTGLLNRRRMSDQMNKELAQARSAQRPLSVLVLDIDHFKAINDEFGHGRGDQVIIAIGQILRANVRHQDLVARWGGEEFLVLQPDAELSSARETAERVRHAVAQYLVRDESDPRPVTVTIGVAMWRDGERLEETIHRADELLYAGKSAGRDRVVIADDSSPALAQKLSA
jgi:diguanylate cyclase (GGDEF)-like protein